MSELTSAATQHSALGFKRQGLSLEGLLGCLALALSWEALPRLGLLGVDYFPPLSAVLLELWGMLGETELYEYMGSTLRTWGIGLCLASALGIAAGLLIGLVPGLRAYTHSTIEFLRPIPSVSLIPGVILVFGSRYQSGVVLITYAAFWPVLLQVLYGLADTDAVARDTARSFRFSRWGYIRHVAWPTLLLFLWTGLRLAAATALVLAVTAEMVIGTVGLGRGIMVAQSSNATTHMYALILVTGLLGVVINLGARALERKALHWHVSVRSELAI